MILNSRNNTFKFMFPHGFIPDEIEKRYQPYLNRVPGGLITKVADLINYSVQSVTIPSIEWDPVVQLRKFGGTNYYRTSQPEGSLVAREFTVTFQLLDGYINYWILADTLMYWYSFNEPDFYIPDGTAIRILDNEGNVIITNTLSNVLFVSLSELDMSFSNNSQEFSTISCTFKYSGYAINVEID